MISISFNPYLDTPYINYIDSIISGCSSLKSINLPNFKTSKVTNMELIFSGCSSLTSINLSNFNTSNVLHMSSMFDEWLFININ